MKLKTFLIVCLMLVVAFSFAAQKLVINSNAGDPEPKRVTNMILEMFQAEYPDIEVELNIFSHEDFKTLLRTWLGANEGPDVVSWFAGERMRYFAEKGLIEPINDVFAQNSFDSYFPKAFQSACSYNGDIYFVPESWYWWAVYYKKSVFADLGITPPTTWEEFLAVCETLQENGMDPLTIGTKYLWTSAAWFDYFNMRVNGLNWYLGVLDGKVPYTDPKLVDAMEYWAVLVENEYFIPDHSSLSWQEALNRLIVDDAGMYLMGQFIKDSTPEAMRDDLDFFRFPIINPDLKVYEETPIDGWMMPKNAVNKESAKLWLEFIASAKIQGIISKELGRLAANKDVPAPDAHAQKGLDMIMASDGVMGFYDRDTNPELANKGMNGFVQFMMFPEMLEDIMKEIEQERVRIFE
ncbi:MAG TPA: ABC transporter substrate-binding protein [Thermotogota bacterium]|nr:ABC transporter substrate-binding protein [Thermotogota bacterium]HRW91630.1 ABC transporter substrate-binding protein [Thermotogota bacterium]